MRTISRFFPVALLICSVLGACSGKEEFSPRKIQRLDLALRSGSVPSDSGMHDAAARLFTISGYGPLTDSTAARYAAMPSIMLHRGIVDSTYPSLENEEKALGEILGRASHSLPAINISEVYAIISPFNQSVFTVDSILYIGLNHYLGEGYAPYEYFPEFIRRKKIRERMMTDVAETLVRGAYPPVPGTVLGRLIYEGAVTEAVIQLTGAKGDVVLDYTPEETLWLKNNENEMWRSLVERKLIFSSNPSDIRSLIAPGAVTSIIHPEAPGASGRFIGHRIVRAYLSGHKKMTLDSLLSPGFYNSETVLRDSRYNP